MATSADIILEELKKKAHLLKDAQISSEEIVLEEHVEKALTMSGISIEEFKNFKPVVSFGLSQSTIKSFWEYTERNICGKMFHHFLLGERIDLKEKSDAMIEGEIFEYWCTGQKNFYNEIPDVDVIKNKNGSLSEKGNKIIQHVKNYQKFVEENKISSIKTGVILKYQSEQYKVTARPDIQCNINSEETIIDLKYSDPDCSFGDFKWNDIYIPFQKKLLLQAIHTQFILWNLLKKEVPFIFYIASKTDGLNAQAKHVILKNFEQAMANHENLVIQTYKLISLLIATNKFIAMPELKRCAACSLDCKFRTNSPKIKTIEYYG